MTTSPEKTANDTEIIYNWLHRTNLSHKVFKHYLQERKGLGERIDEQSEDFNKELRSIVEELVRAKEYNKWNKKAHLKELTTD